MDGDEPLSRKTLRAREDRRWKLYGEKTSVYGVEFTFKKYRAYVYVQVE